MRSFLSSFNQQAHDHVSCREYVYDMLHLSDMRNNLDICIDPNLLSRLTGSLLEDNNNAKQEAIPLYN